MSLKKLANKMRELNFEGLKKNVGVKVETMETLSPWYYSTTMQTNTGYTITSNAAIISTSYAYTSMATTCESDNCPA